MICQISINLHPAQRLSVITVAMAAPIAPYCGMNMILQMTFKTTAIIPFINVNIERPDMGIRRIDIVQNTQKNCPQSKMIKGIRLAEYTGSKMRSKISGNAKQKIKMGRASCNHRVTVFKKDC